MTPSNATSTSRSRSDVWKVYRQDDHGNCFLVAQNRTRESAARLVTKFENRGHKQFYWAEPEYLIQSTALSNDD